MFHVNEYIYVSCNSKFAHIEKVKKISAPPLKVQMELFRITVETNMGNPFEIIVVLCFVWKSLAQACDTVVATKLETTGASAVRSLNDNFGKAETCRNIEVGI
jgi:hypothetical protein